MNILFHHPLPLNREAKSASGIRPIRMIEAFESLGYHVDCVTGYALDRKAAISRIQSEIAEGARYDFMYAEASTMPTTLTDPHHLPLFPLLDWNFFKFCKAVGIPIGLFYRDLYWRFPTYGDELSVAKVIVAKIAYHFDLWCYEKTLKRLYLPSLEMANYLPKKDRFAIDELPPGHDIELSLKKKSAVTGKIRLFYVGGISEHYRMHKLVSAIRSLPEVELVLCTRKEEWEKIKPEYGTLSPNIFVIHLSGTEMIDALSRSDVAILFVEPQEYREFASPVKLYEYLGHLKPIIATNGTLAGKFVAANRIGWSIEYEESELQTLLGQLINDPNLIEEKIENMKRIVNEHTWKARARKVVQDLTRDV